jgi:hypothetical protein
MVIREINRYSVEQQVNPTEALDKCENFDHCGHMANPYIAFWDFPGLCDDCAYENEQSERAYYLRFEDGIEPYTFDNF